MDSDEKDVENLEGVISAGDAWLRKYGVVSDFTHNTIILNIKAKYYPIIQDLEYFIDPNNEKRRIDLTLYIDVKELLLKGKGKYLDKFTKFLPDFSRFLNKERQKKVDNLLDVLSSSEASAFRKVKEDLITDVYEALGEYLHGYRITIRIKRYKKD